MLKSFYEQLELMTKEYIQQKGYVSCEFSTSEDALEEKKEALVSFNQKLRNENLSFEWKMYPCSHCAGNDQFSPVHVLTQESFL